MEIRLIQGDILEHQTQVLVIPEYAETTCLHPIAAQVDEDIDGMISKDLKSGKILTSFGSVNEYLTKGKLPAGKIYLVHMVCLDFPEAVRLIKLEEAIPHIIKKMVMEKQRSCAFFLTTCQTFDFMKASSSYLIGIFNGLSEIRSGDPYSLIEQIDFVERNAKYIPIIFGGISKFFESKKLDEFIKHKSYLRESEPPFVSGNTRLKLRATWKFKSSASDELNYDVFICYRRDTSSEIARLIKMALGSQGLRVFLDVDELPAGHFDESLLQTIDKTTNFIVILSKDCLRGSDESIDWFSVEINHAIKTGRNIVPIIMSGFSFSQAVELQGELHTLPRYHGVNYHHDYFDAMITKLLKYLKPKSEAMMPTPLDKEKSVGMDREERMAELRSDKEQGEPPLEVDHEIMKGLMSESYTLIISSFQKIKMEDRDKYVNALVQNLSNPSDHKKLAAMMGLYYIRCENLAQYLAMMARNPSKAVKRRALIYLGHIRDRGCLGIISGLCSDPSPDVRAAAREAYKKITGQKP